MRRLFFLGSAMLSLVVAYACGGDDTTPPATDASVAEDVAIPPPPPPIDSGPRDAGGKDSALPFDAGGNVSASSFLINEVSGGDEWVEIVNVAAQAQDIGGLVLADRDKDTGEPKIREAVTFPAATMVPQNGYVIVRGGGTGDAGRACPDGGQSHCFNAEFGISNKSGETLFLLAGDGGVLGKVVYPPDGSAGDTSWSRIPSGDPDASFERAKETPGAPNTK